VYGYYGDRLPLEQLIAEIPQHPEGGGTLAVLLGCHALRRGYKATIYTYNVQVFDPTWFTLDKKALSEKLRLQMAVKNVTKLQWASRGYLDFLALGGRLRFEDLTTALIRKYMSREAPILVGLSSTYLYRSVREFGPQSELDDVRGEPAGHFVVLCGYNRERREFLVADPLHTNPTVTNIYPVDVDRLVCSILLGILTHDADLLILEAPSDRKVGSHADLHRRQ
jgi:hypothetical protein